MKRACVIVDGMVHNASERDGQVVLEDGRRLWQDQVTWLPPLPAVDQPRTILAVDRNYRQPSLQAPSEPRAFLKGERSLAGHRQVTKRPAGVQSLRCGGQLAVVIGRTAKKVQRADAYGHVAGYTVANGYVLHDGLEDGSSGPGLQALNRDGATPIGPWLVDAADVPDPMALALKTTVNGKLVQEGSTRDMVFDVPSLVAYFSAFMTLRPGDLILAGTPGGADCQPGDVVVTEIEGVGALMNTIAS